MSRCHCDISCLYPILVGIVSGTLASIFLFIDIPFAIISLVTSIVLFALLLGLILTIAKDEGTSCCVCRRGKCLLAGIFGTFISSVITLTVGSLSGILGGILAFLTVGFFFWMVVAVWLLVKCIINEVCN